MTGEIRILIVDDDDDDALLIRECLAQAGIGGAVAAEHAPTVGGALNRLNEAVFDALLVDYRLGAEDGVSFLARARAAGVEAPAIFLTGQGDQEVAVLAMKAGAADYLVKAKLTPGALGRSLRYALEIRRNQRERQQAANALKESEDRYRRVFDQALTGNYISTLGGRILACNEAFARMLGFGSVAEALAEKAFNLYADPVARDEFLAAVEQDGRLEHWETSLRRHDGQPLSVIENVVAVRDSEGRIAEIQGSILDISGRKRIEQKLLLRERALEAMSQGLLITDPTLPDNPIIYASSGFERMTGYSAAEVLGRNCRFLQGPESNAAAKKAIRDAVAAGTPVSAEIRNYRKDGSSFWNLLSITPIRDGAGRLTHFVGVQTDITAKKAMEDQFRQAQKMEAVGRLAGGVAHDFNNILGVIIGYAEMAQTKLPAESVVKPSLDEIHRAALRAAALTRQLLAYSRKQILSPQIVDLNAIVAGLEGMLARLIGENIEVRTRLFPGLAKVRADPGQLEQIIMNLALNARDAMPDGGNLTLETANAELDERYAQAHDDVKEGRYALLAVSDSGHGMDSATAAQVFEPFFTTKEKGKGTGLGLATVFGIVKQSGGHISLYSEPGRGTTFKIYLPVAVAAAAVDQGRKQQPPAGGSETVLVVEDEPALAALVREMLASLGYRVLSARGGPEALRLARETEDAIQVLLTDVVLPGMSGREVSRRLSTMRPGIRTIYMSGYTDDAIVRHGVLAEGVAFLSKPFTADALAREVRAVLDARAGTE